MMKKVNALHFENKNIFHQYCVR